MYIGNLYVHNYKTNEVKYTGILSLMFFYYFHIFLLSRNFLNRKKPLKFILYFFYKFHFSL